MQGDSIYGTTVGRDLGGAQAVLGSGHGRRPVVRTIAREGGFRRDMFLVRANFWDWGRQGTRFSSAWRPRLELGFREAVRGPDGRDEADWWVWCRLEQVIQRVGGTGVTARGSVDEFVD